MKYKHYCVHTLLETCHLSISSCLLLHTVSVGQHWLSLCLVRPRLIRWRHIHTARGLGLRTMRLTAPSCSTCRRKLALPLDLTPRHTARLTRRSVSRRPASDHTIHTTHPTHTASSLSLSLSRARPLSLVLALTHTHPHTRMHTHPRARTQPCLSTRGAIRLARLSSQIPGKLCHTFARHRTLAVCGMHLRGKGTPR